MPSQQYQNAQNGLNQNQAGAIGALSRSANPGANLASVVRAGDAANANLNANDSSIRQQSQRYSIGQNGLLAQQKIAKQQSDQFDKYGENYNKAAALQGAGMQNVYGGLSDIAGGAGSYLGYKAQTGGFGNPGASQGAANWGAGTMGAKYNSPVLTAAGGTNSGMGSPNFNPYGANQPNMPYGTNWTQFGG